MATFLDSRVMLLAPCFGLYWQPEKDLILSVRGRFTVQTGSNGHIRLVSYYFITDDLPNLNLIIFIKTAS